MPQNTEGNQVVWAYMCKQFGKMPRLEPVFGLLYFLKPYLSKPLKNTAPSDIQPHYGNGVFSNVYLLAFNTFS